VAPARQHGLAHVRASLAGLLRLVPDGADRQAILVENPARLYGRA